MGAGKCRGLCCGCSKDPVNETATGNHLHLSASKEEGKILTPSILTQCFFLFVGFYFSLTTLFIVLLSSRDRDVYVLVSDKHEGNLIVSEVLLTPGVAESHSPLQINALRLSPARSR